MSDITLSNAVRTNLSSLQGTASLLERTQERLSSGNKVNSALDSPVNFFTASGLTERAGDLTNLLDSVSNSVQTLNAADEGISAIQSLVESAEATARQALQAPQSFDSKATVSTSAFDGITEDNLLANPINTEAQLDGLNTIVDDTALQAALQAEVVAAEATAVIDTSATGDTGEFADLTAATEATVTLDYDTINSTEAFATGDTIAFTFSDGSGNDTTRTYTYGTDFTDVDSLALAINNDTEINANVVASNATGDLQLTAADGDLAGSFSQFTVTDADTDDAVDNLLLTDATGTGTGITVVGDGASGGDNDTLVIDIGELTLNDGDVLTVAGETFTYDSAGGNNTTTFSNATDLVTALTANANIGGGSGIAQSGDGGSISVINTDQVQIVVDNTNDVAGGAFRTGTAADYNFDDVQANTNISGTYGTPAAAVTSSSEITVGYGAQSITYTLVSDNATNAANTFTDAAGLAARINEDFGSGTAIFNATNTQIELTGSSGNYTDTFTISGDVTDFGDDASTAAVDDGGVTAPLEAVAADVLTVNGISYTYATTADTTQNEFSNLADLNTLLASQNITATFDATNGIQLSVNSSDFDTTIEVGGSASSALFGTTTYAEATADGSNGLAGQTLTVGSDDATVTLTFGTGSGQVSTLEELNDLINDAGLEASLSDAGEIVFETVNSRGLDTLNLSASTAQENQVNISGTIIQSNGALDGQTVTAAVANADETEARERLVSDYNEILQQITDLAADASYNGINLLNGDDLEVIFNENNTSSLKIEGVTFNAGSLGLDNIVDTDFLDADSINEVLTSLDSASITLRSQASKFGSNLSVVETRQDFTNQLVDVLESGAANLTLADLNEEAANSAALSTRQQIATSALSLAAQSDQGILQLLR